MSYADCTTLVMIFNVVGIPVRLLTGWLVDKYTGPLNCMIPLCLINGVSLLVWIGVESVSGYYVLMTVYGVFAGAFQALFATALVSLSKDMTKNGVVLGMSFLISVS